MQDDIEHSRNRWLDQEELRTKLTGFGTNRQGRAILRKYRDPIAKLLDADRRHPRNREIWRALKDADLVGEQAQTALFIDRLLTMGITAAAGYGIGVDDDGIKNFRDQAIWLGQHLGLRRSQRALEFRAGAWALDRLNGLPVFARDEEDVLTIPLTPGLDEFLNAVVEAGIRNDAFLFPLGQQPEPWTRLGSV